MLVHQDAKAVVDPRYRVGRDLDVPVVASLGRQVIQAGFAIVEPVYIAERLRTASSPFRTLILLAS